MPERGGFAKHDCTVNQANCCFWKINPITFCKARKPNSVKFLEQTKSDSITDDILQEIQVYFTYWVQQNAVEDGKILQFKRRLFNTGQSKIKRDYKGATGKNFTRRPKTAKSRF